jgi:hypothetical protein
LLNQSTMVVCATCQIQLICIKNGVGRGEDKLRDDHIQKITIQLSVRILEAHDVINVGFGVVIRPQNHTLGIRLIARDGRRLR